MPNVQVHFDDQPVRQAGYKSERQMTYHAIERMAMLATVGTGYCQRHRSTD
jgi:hypothetical protein